nr:hypothetical protein BaRGS_029103 [Batillaria attramentaria]
MAPMTIVYQVVRMFRPQLPAAGEASDWREKEFTALYTRCWAGEPNARPTLEEVRSVLERLESQEDE